MKDIMHERGQTKSMYDGSDFWKMIEIELETYKKHMLIIEEIM